MHTSNIILTSAIALMSVLHAIPASASGKKQALPLPAQHATAANSSALTALQQWKAGEQVDMQSVKSFGIDRCFVSLSISDSTFRRMQGKSFKADCTIPRAQLCYLKLLHYTINGKIQLGELVCHKDISADLIDIFRHLFDAHYPIARMVLIDNYGADDELSMNANNTTCFNFRHVAGSKTLSNHSKGKAVDVNPLYNPYVKRRADGTLKISPKAGKAYANRSHSFNYKIDRNDLCYKEFTQHGFQWGGSWKSLKDYQHFEKK